MRQSLGGKDYKSFNDGADALVREGPERWTEIRLDLCKSNICSRMRVKQEAHIFAALEGDDK